MKIGMLTSGGDCQALNAAMRGVVKGLSENDKDLDVCLKLSAYHSQLSKELYRYARSKSIISFEFLCLKQQLSNAQIIKAYALAA